VGFFLSFFNECPQIIEDFGPQARTSSTRVNNRNRATCCNGGEISLK